MFEKKDAGRGKFLSGWFSVGSLGSSTGGFAPPAPAPNGITTEGGTIVGTEGGTNIGTESM